MPVAAGIHKSACLNGGRMREKAMDDEKIIELFWERSEQAILKLRINMGASAGKSHGISWEMKRIRRSV